MFCEVKSKSGQRFGSALEMVDREKQRRLFRAAEAWLVLNPRLRELRISFDVVAVDEGHLRRVPLGDPALSHEVRAGVAQTQAALYDGIDLELSWSERDLPERERTKHVNRLHPYLGKFIPQLVETLLQRYVPAGGRVLDPFAGSGTTLVQALESGHDATGVDIAAFNALLMRVKTERYNLFTLEHELRDACARLDALEPKRIGSRDAGLRPAVVRAGGRRPAPRFSFVDPGLRARRRLQGRAGARGALGAPDDALRPRLPAHASDRAVLVPQAQARVPPGAARRPLPAPLRARHARTRPCLCPGPRARADRERAARRRARARARRPVRGSGHVAAVSGPDRLPRAAPLRVRAARARRPRDVRAGPAARRSARSRSTRKALLACSSARRSRCAAARVWSSS